MAKKWAVSIGINHYAHMLDLAYAKKDAEKMRDWFEKSGFESIYLFTDDSPPIDDASKPYDSTPTGNILKRFFRVRFKAEILGIEDSLWFFFSGHGLRHEGEDYLMPSDADSDSEGIEETAISLKYVTNKLRESGAGDVVIIYDACRNKSTAKGEGFGAAKTKGVITLASCSANEKSYEIDAPEIEQGSFTYALLEALENTQLGRENCATFDRLYQRLRYRVPELNRQYNQPASQKPSGYVEPDEKRYCILLPQQATTQDIEIYKKQALNAEINNNLWEAERLLIRLWEICPGDPEIRQYYNRVIVKQAQQPESKISNLSSQPNSAGVQLAQKDEVFGFEIITVDKHGREVKREKAQAEYFTEDLGSNVSLDMVFIPGGSFLMGTEDGEVEKLCKTYDEEYFRDERPQHKVNINTFFMGRYPITQAQWRKVAGWEQVDRKLRFNPSRFVIYEGIDRWQTPVEQVSWEDAKEFCDRLSKKTGKEYRLPTEAEWEYSCRAGTETPFHFGETISTEIANYSGLDLEVNGKVFPGYYGRGINGIDREQTTPVGYFKIANNFGLYDMHGNVWEWCEDDWHDNYENAPIDGSAWVSKSSGVKVRRGGSWLTDPSYCRSSFRFCDPRLDLYFDIGFRVVCVEA